MREEAEHGIPLAGGGVGSGTGGYAIGGEEGNISSSRIFRIFFSDRRFTHVYIVGKR